MRHLPVLFVVALLLAACDSMEKVARNTPLLPAETFRWSDQPLMFQPPPVKWERGKHNQGGLLGVWFTHRGSVGERIYIAEYTKVGARSKREGHRIPLTIDQVVDQVRFSTDGWPLPPDSFVVGDIQPDTVAGVPAFRLDFTMNSPERSLVGREYYFMKNNYLFEAAYLGLPDNLPLFERVLATVELPDPVEP